MTVPDTSPALSEGAIQLRARILEKLSYEVCKRPADATPRDWFVASAMAIRDRLAEHWLQTLDRGAEKRVCYMSLEFLIGRVLSDSVGNLGLRPALADALASLGTSYDAIAEQEPDAALGNGGLGRLAACYMEAMASTGIAATGYGIRYDHGLFRQTIGLGFWQQEWPETWLAAGNPWEFRRPELTFAVGFGGTVAAVEVDGTSRFRWQPAETVLAVAYDTPVIGAGGSLVNTLRLWSARATDPIRLEAFNRGDHVGALADRVHAEAISRVLYPSDDTPSGQELRLRQEYFFASASLQDIIRRHLARGAPIERLADSAAIQLNDTHPAIGIAELMRLLIDVHGLDWAVAWSVSSDVFHYTNHTLLPEALETWPVPLLERLLPRHMQIIYLINMDHLDRASSDGRSDAFLTAVSLIDETAGRRVRMGHLAFVGARRINGVSALHTALMQRTIFRDLDAVYPGRIVNKTNGITFRRWLRDGNPRLHRLITETVGTDPLGAPEALARFGAHADDAALQQAFRAQRRLAKQSLAEHISRETGITVDPDAMFDVQIKRIHEYKRQLLNILGTIATYDRVRAQPTRDRVTRVKILAGKAAPSYIRAKKIIQLAHDVGRTINQDPSLRGLLKIVFLPNYNVSLAERIVPAADLSEQISTAGMEASGTGNMKLALNGAITIGTLDGANVEIRDHVGAENIVIFGLRTEEVEARRREGLREVAERAIHASPSLADALQAIRSGAFSPDEPDRYRAFIDELVADDRFLVAADFDAYVAAQARIDRLWADQAQWSRMAILNTARTGWFSADRAVGEYADEVWRMPARADASGT